MVEAMENFDILIIGGGPGGYVAAIHAALSGKSTAIVEAENLGGTCLNWGCIPTKSLLRNAEILKNILHSEEFGITVGDVTANYEKAYTRSRAVSAKLVSGIDYLMKKNKITVFREKASFVSKNQIQLNSGKIMHANNIIIATGCVPMALPMLDYTQPNVLNSKGALSLKTAPKSILIIGAGAIGMEFATVFATYGAKVTVAEMQKSILPNEDTEISDVLAKKYISEGMDICVETKVSSVTNDGKTIRATLTGKFQKTVECEYILCAAGIQPNTAGLHLEHAGVRTDARGYITTDDFMRTNVPNIYAIGDINGRLALAHKASAEAKLCVDTICGVDTKPINYANVPKCTYTTPEIASAGLTLAMAKEKGYADAKEVVFPLSANGKAISYGESEGKVKLVFDKKYGELLGVHMAGPHVTEMIYGIVGYLGLEMTIDEMAHIINPHPTISESIMEAAHLAMGQAIHI